MTTRTEGELDDRRVVLYKLGYEPPEEEVQVDTQVCCVRVQERVRGRSEIWRTPTPLWGIPHTQGLNIGRVKHRA